MDAEPKKLYHALPVLDVTGVQASGVILGGTLSCWAIEAVVLDPIDVRPLLLFCTDCADPFDAPCPPQKNQQAKDRRRGGVYEAPCYRVKARRGNNFITTFSLRTEDDKSKWIMRGVALLCSID